MTTYASYDDIDEPGLRRNLITALSVAGFMIYTGFAIFAGLIFPPIIVVFFVPFVLIAIAFTPRGQSVPQTIIWPLLLAAAAMIPVWPTFVHVKIGPLPILTPPRVIFYILTIFWVMDMLASPLRRGQFRHGLKKSFWLSFFALAFFALNAISVPIAEGTKAAGESFFRMLIILFLPFCIFVTYVRRFWQLKAILSATAIGAAIAGVIAVAEFGTGTLLAAKLGPYFSSDATWLQITQELKSRDGKFRAQATHTHPISLSEYLSFCAPLAIAFMLHAKGMKRFWWLVALGAILAGVVVTNSRGGIVSLSAGMGFISVILIWRIVDRLRGAIIMPLIGLMTVFTVLSAPVAYVAFDKLISGTEGTSAARSSQGRIDQITLAWPKILKRPVGGYGTGRSAAIVGYYGRALSLDNYYLSLTVELGFPGPIGFLLMLLIAIRLCLARAKDDRLDFLNNTERWIMIGLAAALASFTVSRMIISQTGNLNFFFPIVAALIGVNAGARKSSRAPEESV